MENVRKVPLSLSGAVLPSHHCQEPSPPSRSSLALFLPPNIVRYHLLPPSLPVPPSQRWQVSSPPSLPSISGTNIPPSLPSISGTFPLSPCCQVPSLPPFHIIIPAFQLSVPPAPGTVPPLSPINIRRYLLPLQSRFPMIGQCLALSAVRLRRPVHFPIHPFTKTHPAINFWPVLPTYCNISIERF
jgi:hypothetical protein